MVKPRGQTAKDAKTRILDAADDVFTRRGTDGARMQEIADQAGVNKALLHYYFRTKADLARAVWFRVASSFLPGVFKMMASDAAIEDKVDQFVDAYLTRLSKHPYLPGYVLSEVTQRPELLAAFSASETGKAARRMVRKLRAQIEEQVEKGAMAPVTTEQLMVTLASCCLFPFAARPVLAALFGIGAQGFDRFIEQRRKELPAFLKRALRAEGGREGRVSNVARARGQQTRSKRIGERRRGQGR